MAHDWDDLILGGLDKPRMLLCTDNWDTNPYFNDNFSNWTKVGSNGTLELLNSTTAYGNSVLNYYSATVSASDDYIYTEYSVFAKLATTVGTKKFIFSARIKTDELMELIITDNSSYTKTIEIEPTNGDFIKIYTITDITTASTSNVIQVRLKTKNTPGDFSIQMDNVFFSQVTSDIVLNQPNDSKLVFKEFVLGRNELWSGKIQRFNRKWKPIFVAKWEYIIAEDEQNRQLIYQAQNIFCIPHQDVYWGFIGIMDGDLERQYSFSRFFGHTGDLEIIGTEYLMELPYAKISDEPTPPPPIVSEIIARWDIEATTAAYRAGDAWVTFKSATLDNLQTFRLAELYHPSTDLSALSINALLINGGGRPGFNYNDYVGLQAAQYLTQYLKKLTYVDYTGITDVTITFSVGGTHTNAGQISSFWLVGSPTTGGVKVSTGTSQTTHTVQLYNHITLATTTIAVIGANVGCILWWNVPTKTAKLYVDGGGEFTQSGSLDATTSINWKEFLPQWSHTSSTTMSVNIASILLTKSGSTAYTLNEITKIGIQALPPNEYGIVQKFGINP